MSQLAIHPNEVWSDVPWRDDFSRQVVILVAVSVVLHALVVGVAKYWTTDDDQPIEEAIPHEMTVQLTKYVPPQPQQQPKPLVASKAAEASAVSVPVQATPAAPSVRQEVYTEPDVRSAYLHNPAPPYPAQAQRLNWEGVVQLKVLVLSTGHAGDVVIHQSSGRRSLDDSALQTVKRWTFTPAKKGAVAVEAWVIVPIEFKLGN